MNALLRHLPRPAGLLPLQRDQLGTDVLAGLTLAALAIPEVMGYTRISQTPVVTGLYTMLLPMVAFALLGASRHLVVAADSATAAILVATLAGVAPPGSATYVGLTMAVAVAVALFLLLAALLRLGFLADFLSRSALIGLLSGIGVQVAASELAGLFGLPQQGQGALQQLLATLARLPQSRIDHLLVALGVLGVIAACRRLDRRLPGALIAVAGSILISALLDFPGRGLDVVGAVPGGLPHLVLPVVAPSQWNAVLVSAASCFVVILAQSSATARAYAQRYRERNLENVDLVGLASANLAAGLSGSFVVNGSPTKTEMVDAAGGRSQLAHLTAAAVVLLVLLFFTRPLGLLPAAVLSTIVFLIGLKLIDWKGLRELWRLQRNEFVIALATVITVAQAGVMPGILLAVVLSLIEQVRHTYRPRTCLWAPRPDGSELAHGSRGSRGVRSTGDPGLPLRSQPLLRQRQSLQPGGAVPRESARYHRSRTGGGCLGNRRCGLFSRQGPAGAARSSRFLRSALGPGDQFPIHDRRTAPLRPRPRAPQHGHLRQRAPGPGGDPPGAWAAFLTLASGHKRRPRVGMAQPACPSPINRQKVLRVSRLRRAETIRPNLNGRHSSTQRFTNAGGCTSRRSRC